MKQSRLLLLLSLLLIGVLALSACGGTTTPADSAGSSDTAASDADSGEATPVGDEGLAASVTTASDLAPPIVAEPCGDDCPYTGQTVTVIVNTAGEKGPISGPIYEVRDEFEAATGATLEIVEVPFAEHFPKLMTDLTTGSGQYDTSIAGAWWLGDLVEGGFILPYDDMYNAEGFPEWDFEDVLPGPRSLLEYGGQKYVVGNDHDGQVMYYRRDLLEDPDHQAAFEAEYGYPLAVPETWAQFRDVAEYFDGKDLNGDGQPDDGLTMHLKVANQGMFHFMSFSAPFVIGPDNPNLYWFDPETMDALVDSPGHVRAMETMIDLVQFGPEAMMAWNLGESWDHFLRGEAALTFTWGDLGALAQEEGSQVRGLTGAAPIPGTTEYYDVTAGEWKQVDGVNRVGNTTGGSWSGVISKDSDAPEATYFLLALMASKPKSSVYAARGWDGVDPGRYSHFLPPNGDASMDDYLAAGWDEQDIQDYSNAYYENFNAELQFPYLRIPGAFEYWTSLDIHLSEAATGQATAEEALQATADEFEQITDRLGRDMQQQSYVSSLGLE
ncbi:MAG: extracellular solute-binding protein [Caldilineaceae bacterium]|nr:extracellular solute-binding protein [Caldilineaceae bacterium]MCB9139125.1 extracellular solute-binding protein [Caldilineaceae bacterium]